MSELNENLIGLTADIVGAHVSHNSVGIDALPGLISSVFKALNDSNKPVEPQVRQEPAVPIRSSVKRDYLISLESGRKVKMLKRYLMTNYTMTPEDYRRKWGLPADYPMVAPAYAEQRRSLAVAIGLGRGGRGGGRTKAVVAKKGRPKVATAKPASRPKASAKAAAKPAVKAKSIKRKAAR